MTTALSDRAAITDLVARFDDAVNRRDVAAFTVFGKRNYGDDPMLKLADMPEIRVEVIPSTQKPSGVGETAMPPAVCNALSH